MKASLQEYADPRAPLVSVIIPTYNRRRLLEQAIQSVFDQTYPNVELIVVDDGSTDETAIFLDEFKQRLTVLRQSNRGVSAARNRGIRAAGGEYICFLDSDDYWKPPKLELQLDFFKDHPQFEICQTEEIWIRNGVRINPKKRHRKREGDIYIPSLELCLISPSAVMMRTALFDKVGLFDERLPACEDYDLWLRISHSHPIGLVKTPAIVKRGGHADQLSAMPELDKYRIQAMVKILDSGELSTDQYNATVLMLSQKCKIYSTGCRKRGRFQEALYYANLTNRFTPS
jgi:glycosyltransferase involved in cell wall biosynthesis